MREVSFLGRTGTVDLVTTDGGGGGAGTAGGGGGTRRGPAADGRMEEPAGAGGGGTILRDGATDCGGGSGLLARGGVDRGGGTEGVSSISPAPSCSERLMRAVSLSSEDSAATCLGGRVMRTVSFFGSFDSAMRSGARATIVTEMPVFVTAQVARFGAGEDERRIKRSRKRGDR